MENFVLLRGRAQYDNGIFTSSLPIIKKRQAALWPGLCSYQVEKNVPVAASMNYLYIGFGGCQHHRGEGGGGFMHTSEYVKSQK
jgi:hypothetical protein